MNRKLPRLFLWMFRGSEAELGDVMEEYSANRQSIVWLARQALSTWAPRPRRATIPERRASMLSSFWSDVRYAVRGLIHNPGFTAAAVLAIALGIGINTGIFSLLNGLALRELPAPDSESLVAINQRFQRVQVRNVHGMRSMFSTAEYERYRDNVRSLNGILGYSTASSATLGGESPREIYGTLVTCNYFEVLNVPLAMGAGFTPANCGEPVVILSHNLWAAAFNSDPAILGKTVLLNRQRFRVTGVAAKGFEGIDLIRVGFFIPVASQLLLEPQWSFRDDPNLSWLALIGRRDSRTELDTIRAELSVISAQIDSQQAGRETRILVDRATALSSHPEVGRELLPAATIVLAAFGLVLLIACANVANLLLARGAGRSREIAVRLSIGSTRARLVRQLLTESLVLSAAGGLLGSVLSAWSFQSLLTWVIRSIPADVPPLMLDPSPNITVLYFALGLTFATGIIFGLAPALQASKADLVTAMKQDSTGSGRRTGGWLRGALLGVQVAVCMVLMIAAGLLLRGLYAAQTIDPGFNYKDVIAASFDLTGYDDSQTTEFYRRIRERVAGMPGVRSVALTRQPPLSEGRMGTRVRLPGSSNLQQISLNFASPGFFSILDLPILRGRDFTASDLVEPPASVIVTETTARQLWPGQDPIDQTVLTPFGPGSSETTWTVVGVVKDAQVSRISEIAPRLMYLPARRGDLMVRSERSFEALAPAIAGAAREIDAGVIVKIQKLESNLDFWRALAKLVATLSSSLGALALLLASIGVYGVVSYMVNRRIREVGIRMVLGARSREVLGMILRESMTPVAIGLAAGVAACAAVSRILSAVLFGVSALDPIAFIGAPLFLLAVAAIASWLPARRATRGIARLSVESSGPRVTHFTTPSSV